MNDNWTKEEMDSLYEKVRIKAATDLEFRKELMENSKTAIEKLVGKKLPEGCSIKVIEQDPAYTATWVLPDVVTEEMDLEELNQISGGISFLLVFSACAVAISSGGCPADACSAAGCIADNFCGAQACAAKGKTL